MLNPVAAFASVTTTVRLVPVPERVNHRRTAMLLAGIVIGRCSTGVSGQLRLPLPGTASSASAAAGGLRDSCNVLPATRRLTYSGLLPVPGIRDGETISVGAAGVAPGPFGWVIVAALSIGVPGLARASTRTSSALPDPSPDLVARLQAMYAADPALAQALERARGLRSEPGMPADAWVLWDASAGWPDRLAVPE